MTPTLLSPLQIKQLIVVLESSGDKSLQMRSALLTEVQYGLGGLKVWVDSWPDFNAVVFKRFWPQSVLLEYNYYVYASDEQKLKEMLLTPGLISWKNSFFLAFPCSFNSILALAADKHGYCLKHPTAVFEIYRFKKDNTKPVQVPEDVTVRELDIKWADLVAANWGYIFHDYNETKQLIRIFIKTYPSVCLYNAEGRPVAYALGQESGTMGMLYVDPDYRERGFAKVVIALLTKKYLYLGYDPYVSLDTSNEKLIKLHVSLGFEATGCTVQRYIIFPK